MNLDDAFWPALWSLVALPSGTRPEVFLAVWLAESGLEPSAQNAIGCTGLNQSCPAPNGPGFPGGDAAAYRSAPASAQLAWIAPQVMRAIALNGGAPFTSAARYYQANFLPATLPKATGPDDVIAGAEGPYASAYAANRDLDVDGDGAITLDDLGASLERTAAAYGSTLSDAIAAAYAHAPPGAPWESPAVVFYPPGGAAPAPSASRPSGGRGGGVAIAVLALGGALTVAFVRGRR